MTSITRKDGVTLPSVSELAERFFGKFNVEPLKLDTAFEIIKRRFIFESSQIIENAKHENNPKAAQAKLEAKIRTTLTRAEKFEIHADDLQGTIQESRKRLNDVLVPKNLS